MTRFSLFACAASLSVILAATACASGAPPTESVNDGADRVAQTDENGVERVAQVADDDSREPVGDPVATARTTRMDTIPPDANTRLVEDYGESNRAVQTQIGDYMTSRIRQTLGSSHSLAHTIQHGANLFASVVQSGARHAARIAQTGDGVSATVVQESVGNEASLSQDGSGLSATIVQTAAFGKVFVSQTGIGSSAVIVQR